MQKNGVKEMRPNQCNFCKYYGYMIEGGRVYCELKNKIYSFAIYVGLRRCKYFKKTIIKKEVNTK